jgi:hypothetical protein
MKFVSIYIILNRHTNIYNYWLKFTSIIKWTLKKLDVEDVRNSYKGQSNLTSLTRINLKPTSLNQKLLKILQLNNIIWVSHIMIQMNYNKETLIIRIFITNQMSFIKWDNKKNNNIYRWMIIATNHKEIVATMTIVNHNHILINQIKKLMTNQ